MSPSAKNRQTFSKLARERAVKEKRELKQEKKDEKKRLAAEARGEEGAESEPASPPTDE